MNKAFSTILLAEVSMPLAMQWLRYPMPGTLRPAMDGIDPNAGRNQ
jgi:hypothetical protein